MFVIFCKVHNRLMAPVYAFIVSHTHRTGKNMTFKPKWFKVLRKNVMSVMKKCKLHDVLQCMCFPSFLCMLKE